VQTACDQLRRRRLRAACVSRLAGLQIFIWRAVWIVRPSLFVWLRFLKRLIANHGAPIAFHRGVVRATSALQACLDLIFRSIPTQRHNGCVALLIVFLRRSMDSSLGVMSALHSAVRRFKRGVSCRRLGQVPPRNHARAAMTVPQREQRNLRSANWHTAASGALQYFQRLLG